MFLFLNDKQQHKKKKELKANGKKEIKGKMD